MPFNKGRDYGLTLDEFNEWKRLSDDYCSLARDWSENEDNKWQLENACIWLEKFEREHNIEDEICPDEY